MTRKASKMTFSRYSNVLIAALVVSICLCAQQLVIVVGAHRPSFSRGADLAQDPNFVNDDHGWTWGVSRPGNHRHHPFHPGHNADFDFYSNEFYNAGDFPRGTNNVDQGQEAPQHIASASTTTVTPSTTTPTVPPAAGRNEPMPGIASAASVVYSDEFYECMSQCRTTNEWNPVCGSDNNNYNNIEKLNCANSCGGNVQELRKGPCRPAGK